MAARHLTQHTPSMTAPQFPSNLPAEPPRDHRGGVRPELLASMGDSSRQWRSRGSRGLAYFSALKRYKWLILFVVLAGTGIGFGVTQFMTPAYQTQGTIWISENVAQQGMQRAGPDQGDPLVTPGAWADLIKSSAIMDNVVRKYLALPVAEVRRRTAPLFAGFQPQPGLHPGNYVLTTDATNTHYTLTTNEGKRRREGSSPAIPSGARSASRGSPSAIVLGPSRIVAFTVVSPRDISSGLDLAAWKSRCRRTASSSSSRSRARIRSEPQ